MKHISEVLQEVIENLVERAGDDMSKIVCTECGKVLKFDKVAKVKYELCPKCKEKLDNERSLRHG